MAILRGRAPLRLGLGGGGTDVEPYSSQFGGRILSVTIDKYAYAFAERGTGDEIAFRSPDRDRAGQASIDDLASLEEDFPLHGGDASHDMCAHRLVAGPIRAGATGLGNRTG